MDGVNLRKLKRDVSRSIRRLERAGVHYRMLRPLNDLRDALRSGSPTPEVLKGAENALIMLLPQAAVKVGSDLQAARKDLPDIRQRVAFLREQVARATERD